jgi:hypothetical protein
MCLQSHIGENDTGPPVEESEEMSNVLTVLDLSRLYRGESPREHPSPRGMIRPSTCMPICRLEKYHHFHWRLCNDFAK